MESTTIQRLNRWFSQFVKDFLSHLSATGNAAVSTERDALILKAQHTGRVRAEIRALGHDLALDPAELHLVDAMALLHDVGRFAQFTRYGTFADGRSVNHAELGVEILQVGAVLAELPAFERNLILQVIRYHNRIRVPAEASDHCRFYTKMLRDADKLDIWRVVTNHYADPEQHRNGAIELDLPDTPGYDPKVGRDLLAGRVADVANLNNLNDLKLAQAGWIYDVNFRATFFRIKRRGILEQLRIALPSEPGIDTIFAVIASYLDQQLQKSSEEREINL